VVLFNIHSFGYFTRASRSYAVTEKGKTFLEKPCNPLVLNLEAFQHSKAKDPKTKRIKTGTDITYVRFANYYSTIKGGRKLKKKGPMNILVSKRKKIILITSRISRKQWYLAHEGVKHFPMKVAITL